MTDQIEKLTTVYDQLNSRVAGSLHNTLWQIMVNNSLDGAEAAFADVPGQDCIAIALGEGGFIPANFEIVDPHEADNVLERLNREVFGLTPEGAESVLIKSMWSSNV
jgi:hypothetical protein